MDQKIAKKTRALPLGFTIIELLVSSAVFIILLSVGLANYSRINRQQIFHQTVKNVLEDLRLAQDKALSGEKPSECRPPANVLLAGYRVTINPDNRSYEIRSVCEGLAQEPVCKSAALRTGVTITQKPDEIFFRVLTKGVDLGGVETGTITLQGYGLVEQIVITESGEIYSTRDLIPTTTPAPTGAPTPTPTPRPPTPTPTRVPTPTSTPRPPTPTPTQVPTLTPTPSDTALAGLWHLEEEGTSIRYDSSAKGNHLSVSAGDTINRSTDAMQGLYSADFEKDDSEFLFITDAGQTGLDITGNITVSVWVKPESLTGMHNMVAKWKEAGPDRGYALYRSTTDVVIFDLSNNGSTENYAYTPVGQLTVGAWTHVAGVYNGTDIRIYINGVLSANGSHNPQAYSSGIHNTDASFTIGSVSDPGFYFDGLIDEVAIYNRALSASEIAGIYASHN